MLRRVLGGSHDTAPAVRTLVMVGACYVDTILEVDHYPAEDEKLRASSLTKRRGGNCPNSLEVIQQLVDTAGTEACLYLATALPDRASAGTQFVKKSLGPLVNLDRCFYRSMFDEPASCYVMRSESTGSRTIVNHNPLPDMTVDEFKDITSYLADDHPLWYHFEGRIPEITLKCLQWLRKIDPEVIISVEAENPSRAGLDMLIAEADVVFYAKGWAQANGYTSPEQCLRDQARLAPRASCLCCTWGEEGAAVLSLPDHIYASTAAWTMKDKQVIDTIGAGDTFVAGMLFGLIYRHDWTMTGKLRFANELAGRKVFQEGFQGLGVAVIDYIR